MTCSAILAVLLPALVTAAPVPKLAADRFGTFGTAVETKGVTCETPRKGELRISVAKEASTDADTHRIARPNVARTVEGDFELTVRITHAPADAKDVSAAAGKGEVIAAAGIALHRADGKRGSLVVLNRLSKGRDAWDTYFKFFALYETKETRGATGDLSGHHGFAGTPISLRLTRHGDVFTAARSDDGKEWSPVFKESHTVPGLGAEVVIGPVAAHNTNTRYDVTFDQYDLKLLKKEK